MEYQVVQLDSNMVLYHTSEPLLETNCLDTATKFAEENYKNNIEVGVWHPRIGYYRNYYQHRATNDVTR